MLKRIIDIRVCIICKKKLKSLKKDDWDKRCLHKKCWKEERDYRNFIETLE